MRAFRPSGAGRWQLEPAVGGLALDQRCNLIEDQHDRGCFDLILIRNALIYFADATLQAIIDRLEAMIRPGAHLIFGSAEVLADSPRSFTALPESRRPIFRKSD